jgi:hypothetical protein
MMAKASILLVSGTSMRCQLGSVAVSWVQKQKSASSPARDGWAYEVHGKDRCYNWVSTDTVLGIANL